MLWQQPGDNNISIPSSKKLTIKSSDGETFEVDEEVALKSKTIKRMIEETSSRIKDVITLPIVTSNILAKVLQYCKKHLEDDKDINKELRAWDADFVKLDKDTLFQLVLAANYLGIERLVDLASEGAWSKVRPKKGVDIRKMHGNNYSSDEDQEIEMDFIWVSGSYTR